MKFAVETVAVGVGAFLALLGAAFARDNMFAAHMWVLFFVLLISVVVMLRNVNFSAAKAAPGAADTSGYNDEVVKYGAIATLFWGIVGFLVGVVVAAQLAFPDLNIEPWFNFGRMRPLHTSAVIFRLWRQRTAGNVLLRRAAHDAGAAVGRQQRPGSSSGAISSLSSWRRQAIFSALPRAANMRSRNGMWISG